MNMSFDRPSSDMLPIVLEVIERLPRPQSPLHVEMFHREDIESEDTEGDDVSDEGDGYEAATSAAAAPEGDDTEDDEVDDDEIKRVLSRFITTEKVLPTSSKAVPPMAAPSLDGKFASTPWRSSASSASSGLGDVRHLPLRRPPPVGFTRHGTVIGVKSKAAGKPPSRPQVRSPSRPPSRLPPTPPTPLQPQQPQPQSSPPATSLQSKHRPSSSSQLATPPRSKQRPSSSGQPATLPQLQHPPASSSTSRQPPTPPLSSWARAASRVIPPVLSSGTAAWLATPWSGFAVVVQVCTWSRATPWRARPRPSPVGL
jgi:hypothetical protein